MDSVMSQEKLAEIFDQVICDITQREAGIRLCRKETEISGEMCTVYAVFNKGYQTSLTLCAELALFRRLTQRMMAQENVTLEDIEIFVKEYFNVMCGHIASRLFQLTKIPARFSVPDFYWGRYEPEDQLEHVVLTYASEADEHAQLTHRTPITGPIGG